MFIFHSNTILKLIQNYKLTSLYGAVNLKELSFQLLTMINLLAFIFDNMMITFLFALYLSLVFSEDARLLMVYLFSFELGTLFSYWFSQFISF